MVVELVSASPAAGIIGAIAGTISFLFFGASIIDRKQLNLKTLGVSVLSVLCTLSLVTSILSFGALLPKVEQKNKEDLVKVEETYDVTVSRETKGLLPLKTGNTDVFVFFPSDERSAVSGVITVQSKQAQLFIREGNSLIAADEFVHTK